MFCEVVPAVKIKWRSLRLRMWVIKGKEKGLLSDFVPSMALSIITTYEILMCYLSEVRSIFSV